MSNMDGTRPEPTRAQYDLGSYCRDVGHCLGRAGVAAAEAGSKKELLEIAQNVQRLVEDMERVAQGQEPRLALGHVKKFP